MLPNVDPPEAFGQHPNADIQSQIQETRMLFNTLLSLQPQISTGGGESREDKVGGGQVPVLVVFKWLIDFLCAKFVVYLQEWFSYLGT